MRRASRGPRSAWASAAVAGALLLATACGSGEIADDSPAPAAPPFTAEGQDRPVVARVAGEPIYADCVERQARARDLDRDRALEACIELELLALEAKRRGLLTDPDVVMTSRREAVRALLDAELEPQDPADLDVELLRDLWERPRLVRHPLADYYNHEEIRRASYCLFQVPEGASPGGADDLLSLSMARAAYAAAVGRTEIDSVEFVRLCQRVNPPEGPRLEAYVNAMIDRSQVERGAVKESFAGPLFALGAPGSFTAPTRTEGGWLLLYLDAVRPAQNKNFEEALPDLRRLVWGEDPWFDHPPWPEILRAFRQSLFYRWYANLEERFPIDVYAENLPESRMALP